MNKIISIIIFTIAIIVIMSVILSNIFTRNVNVLIDKVEIIDKSNVKKNKDYMIHGLSFNPNIILEKEGYIKYKIIIKNHDKDNYKINGISINDTPNNKYLSYSISVSDDEIKSNKTIDVYLTIRNETKKDKKNSINNPFKLNIYLLDEAGKILKANKKIKDYKLMISTILLVTVAAFLSIKKVLKKV